MLSLRVILSVSAAQEWLERKDHSWDEADQISTVFFIVQVLHAVHNAGMALCDLTPASFAWYARKQLIQMVAESKSVDADCPELKFNITARATGKRKALWLAGAQRRRAIRLGGGWCAARSAPAAAPRCASSPTSATLHLRCRIP